MFKKYDIRAIYPEEINEKKSYDLGRSFGTIFQGESFGVGRDTRETSKKIKDFLIKGLLDSGINVAYLDVSTTPMMSFYSMDNNRKSLEITASHNPKEYTGVKVFKEDGLPFNDFREIEKIFKNKSFTKGEGSLSKVNFGERYIKKITKEFNSNLRVVTDTIGGAASYYCPESLRRIGCDVFSIYNEYSENFYDRNPEPKKENLHDLRKEVLNQEADFGVAIDPDGDRTVFVDDKGSVIEGTNMNYIFLSELSPLKAIATIDNSQKLEKIPGVNLQWSKIGNVFVEKIVKETNAEFGCEASGHFCFGNYLPTMDGTLSSLVLADLLEESEKSLSDIHKEIEKTDMFYQNFEYDTIKKRNRVFEHFLNSIENKENTLTLDGVKVVEEDYWYLLRPSNTEPKIRLTIESDSKDKNKRIYKKIKQGLEEFS